MYGTNLEKNNPNLLNERERLLLSAHGFGFKPASVRTLADAIIAHLEPIQTKYKEYAQDTEYLQKVLAEGAEAATEEASHTCTGAKRAMGFTMPGDAPKV